MTQEVIEGHIRSIFYSKINFFLYTFFFILRLILSKVLINADIVKMQFFPNMNIDLRGHCRSLLESFFV